MKRFGSFVSCVFVGKAVARLSRLASPKIARSCPNASARLKVSWGNLQPGILESRRRSARQMKANPGPANQRAAEKEPSLQTGNPRVSDPRGKRGRDRRRARTRPKYRLWKLFRPLIPKDFPLDAFMSNVLTDQVAGLYDPKAKEFYIADWIPADEQREVMSHELTHALEIILPHRSSGSKLLGPNDELS